MKRVLAVLFVFLFLLNYTITKAPAAAGLSDDPYSFQLQIDGELYSFPMTYADFTAKGWVCDGDDAALLDANYYSSESFKLGGLRCYARVINFDVSALPVSQCYVGGITLDEYEIQKAKGFSLVLPGGLAYGAATADDAQALYGTPSYVYEGELYNKYSYQYASYRELSLRFSSETGALNAVELMNLKAPADFVPSEISAEIPAIVTAYAAPEAVSDNLADFTASYGGVIYQLPVPVSVMMENGWKLADEDSEATVSGRDSGWVTLMMDNQRLRILARNYSENATAASNCFATSFESSDSCKIDLVTAKGLTVGMREADLLAALAGETYEKQESPSYTCYTVSPADSALDGYELYVRDGAVYKLKIAYSPKFSAYTAGR